MKGHCPNINACKLVNDDTFDISLKQKEKYLKDYCKADDDKWIECKRYQSSIVLGSVADFVLPDIDMPMEEILERIQKENSDDCNCNG